MGPFSLNGDPPEYYRAKILSIENAKLYHSPEQRQVGLYFIDFGNTAEALVKDLRVVLPELLHFAPMALEAVLTGVAPSLIRNPQGKWLPQAKTWFEEQTLDKALTAKVSIQKKKKKKDLAISSVNSISYISTLQNHLLLIQLDLSYFNYNSSMLFSCC